MIASAGFLKPLRANPRRAKTGEAKTGENDESAGDGLT
jgi:hypothetical protein